MKETARRDRAVEERALQLAAGGLAWLAAVAQAHDEHAAEEDEPIDALALARARRRRTG